MTLKTRKPTGKPAWPITLIAGTEKAGKSYAAAQACSSPLIDRALWVPVGEDDPDELGSLGDFEIVEHDGTVRGITLAVRDAVDELAKSDNGLLVIDSIGMLWDRIKFDLQAEANRRHANRGRGRTNADGDAQITMDLWNLGRSRWDNVMDELRRHQGPSIVTARMDLVTVMDDNGQPTGKKDWTIAGHKTLPFDAGAVVKMPARGEVYLTGVRSLRLNVDPTAMVPAKGWSMHGMWEQMGLADDAGRRVHQASRDPETEDVAAARDLLDRALAADSPEGVRALGGQAKELGLLEVVLDGASLNDRLVARMRDLASGVDAA